MTRKNKGKITIWVSAGVVAAALFAGVIGIVAMQSAPMTPINAGDTVSPAKPDDTVSSDGACDVPGGDITAVPGDLSWETVQGISWPVSASLGPVAEKDGFPVCFSHSPVGAALAAHTVFFETMRHEPRSVSEFYVVDSPGKSKAIDDAGSLTSEGQLASFRSTGASAAGFRVDEYTGDRALVYIVLASPNARTGFRGVAFPLEWVEGDWRVRLLDTGTGGPAIDVLNGQFTEWAD